MQKVIATPPGQPPIYVDLTEAELLQRQIDQAAWEAAQNFVPLADQLDTAFSALPLDLQAQFSPLRAAIKLELEQGRNEVAKRVIELADIPPELEGQRQALINLFPEV